MEEKDKIDNAVDSLNKIFYGEKFEDYKNSLEKSSDGSEDDDDVIYYSEDDFGEDVISALGPELEISEEDIVFRNDEKMIIQKDNFLIEIHL